MSVTGYGYADPLGRPRSRCCACGRCRMFICLIVLMCALAARSCCCAVRFLLQLAASVPLCGVLVSVSPALCRHRSLALDANACIRIPPRWLVFLCSYAAFCLSQSLLLFASLFLSRVFCSWLIFAYIHVAREVRMARWFGQAADIGPSSISSTQLRLPTTSGLRRSPVSCRRVTILL